MGNKTQFLTFQGINAPVSLHVDHKFEAALPAVFARWPFELSQEQSEQPFVSVEQDGPHYILSSPFMDKDIRHKDPLNAICALVVEIAWARLRQEPELLCLHGAAVEFSGRLVVFPSTRRAGKSTLSVALAAYGKTVFTDDFLPIQIPANKNIEGVSNGISPRLRLPVPEQFGPKASAYIATCGYIKNGQYQYVAPNGRELASFGDSAPIGALVFLERKECRTPVIEKVNDAEALKTLITQNFSRAINADAILQVLASLTRGVPAYRLCYNDVDPAVDLLSTTFSDWTAPPPQFEGKITDALFTSALDVAADPVQPDITTDPLLRSGAVTSVSADGKRFLTGHNGKSIHYLNEGAEMIWRLLEEPTTADEAVELLCSVFPEQPEDIIRGNVMDTLESFAKSGLLLRATGVCQNPPVQADSPSNQPAGKTRV